MMRMNAESWPTPRCSPREPERQIEQDSGGQAGLGEAECDAGEIEGGRPSLTQAGGRAVHQPPGDQDPGDPPAGAEAAKGHVARDFDEDVAEERRGRRRGRSGLWVEPEVFARMVGRRTRG